MDLSKKEQEKLKLILASELIKSGIGSVRLKQIYKDLLGRDRLKASTGRVDSMADEIRRNGVEIVGFWEEKYPRELLQLSDHPVLLFVKGDISLLRMPKVTIVGTRRSTVYGAKVVDSISKELVRQGIVAVSGLAYGIDGKVHRSIIRSDVGKTIGVVAGGIDGGYPQVNRDIYNVMAKEHLIIAEFPPGRPMIKGMFPMRNRLMAGLSSHTIVVEAPVDSGSLITARGALDLGREVFSVPGDIDRVVSRGSNLLINDGARPICSHLDIKEICIECENFFMTDENA